MKEKRRARRGWLAAAILSSLLSVSALAQDGENDKTIYDLPPVDESHIASKYKATLAKPPNVEWFLGAELGFLAVASHVVQLSNDGTRFNYRDDGGQDVLFPFFRLSTDLKFKGRHAARRSPQHWAGAGAQISGPLGL